MHKQMITTSRLRGGLDESEMTGGGGLRNKEGPSLLCLSAPQAVGTSFLFFISAHIG